MKLLLAIPVVGVLAAMAGGASAGSDPLDGYRWKSRVLVVAAPDEADPHLAAQRRALAAARGGVSEREIVTVEAVGPGATASAIRQRLQIAADRFRAVLIGKDGGAKLSSDEPISAQTLFATIDAMPMRQQEMKR